MNATHELKCWVPYFDDVASGRKTFEVRRDDRGFAEGDKLWLREWVWPTPNGDYSGKSLTADVTYVLRDAERFGVMAGFVVLGLRVADVPAGDKPKISTSGNTATNLRLEGKLGEPWDVPPGDKE